MSSTYSGAAGRVISGVPVPEVPSQLFIDGEWRDASDGATFDVIAPASEEPLAKVATVSDADVDAAVRAARREADGGTWSRLTGADRVLLLYRVADLVERNLETFVTLEALDIGRPAYEPRLVDIPNAVDVFRHFAGWADKIEGRWVAPLPAFGRTRQAYTIREPLGVVGAITATTTSPTPSAGPTTPVTGWPRTCGPGTCPGSTSPPPPESGVRLGERARRPGRATAVGRHQDERRGPRTRLGRDRGQHRGEDRNDHPVTTRTIWRTDGG